MKYTLEVIIEPEKHYIHVEGATKNVNCKHLEQIFLNENYNIKSLKSQTGELDFVFDKTGDRPPFDTISRPVIINSDIDDLYFEYDGVITEVMSGVNQINEDLVELACYSGWYPKIFDLSFKFAFEINLKISKGYFVTTNGSISLTESGSITNQYILKSTCNVMDIVIFASPKVSHTKKATKGLEVNIYCADKAKDIAQLKMDKIVAGYEILTKLFGDNQLNQQIMNYIYRPFGGWAYAREGLVIMPEQDIIERTLSKYDLANYVHIDLHELAHNWWNIASTTKYDWINEGLAEFSSLTLIKEMFGDEVFASYVESYAAKIEDEEEAISILDTKSNSPDRELNHYIKTALMYIGAEKRYGKQALFGFLKKYFQHFSGTDYADTDSFLIMCETEIGKDAREYFQHLLTSKGWEHLAVKKDLI